MSEAEDKIWDVIKNALKPRGNVDVIQWTKDNCYVTESERGSTVDLNLTPYFKEIFIETLTNPNLKHITICSPVGSGKTTMFLALITITSALFPKQTMIIGQSEQQTVDFLDLLVKPAMRKNKIISAMWPKRNMDRKESLHFPTHSIYTGYATAINTLQSRSISLLLCDESWLYPKGIITEAAARLHNRPGARMLNVSQGSFLNDEFHLTFQSGQIKEYAWECPSCKGRNIYKFEDLKFEYDKTENDIPVYNTVHAHLQCPCCEHKVEDTIENRRSLSENSIYIISNPDQNYIPHNISYNFNQLAVYDISWKDLAIEFLAANVSNNKAYAIRQFFQKKMAQFFDESKFCQTIDLESLESGYKMDEFKFEQWDMRILTADIQMDRMFVCIRDWSKEGASRLVAYKYCSTFSDIEKIRIDYNVKSKGVFLDSAYRPEEVKLAGGTYGWLGLNGLGDRSFKITNRNGKTIERIFSQPVNYAIKTNTGLKQFQVTNYNGVAVKDTLTTIQSNPNNTWRIPNGGENYDMYIHQLTKEVRLINRVTGKPYYKKVGDEQNHSLDCECMQIVGAMIWKLLIFAEDEVSD